MGNNVQQAVSYTHLGIFYRRYSLLRRWRARMLITATMCYMVHKQFDYSDLRAFFDNHSFPTEYDFQDYRTFLPHIFIYSVLWNKVFQ